MNKAMTRAKGQCVTAGYVSRHGRVLAVFVALCVSRAAYGEFVVTLNPEQPAENEDVFIHVVEPGGAQCFPPYSIVSMDGDSIIIELWSTDACAAEDYVSERDYRVGAFASGSYSLDVEFCVSNPPPFPSGCGPLANLSFNVAGAGQEGRGLAVPINSKYAAILLALAVVFVSARRLIGRPRSEAPARCPLPGRRHHAS